MNVVFVWKCVVLTAFIKKYKKYLVNKILKIWVSYCDL